MKANFVNLSITFFLLIAFLCLSVFGKSTSSPAATSSSHTKVNSTKGRSSRSGLDANYGLWQQQATAHGLSSSGFGRQDMIPLIPIALLFGLGLMLIPFLSSFIAQVLAPAGPPVYSGRRKRNVDSSKSNYDLSETIFSYIKMLQKSIETYGF